MRETAPRRLRKWRAVNAFLIREFLAKNSPTTGRELAAAVGIPYDTAYYHLRVGIMLGDIVEMRLPNRTVLYTLAPQQKGES